MATQEKLPLLSRASRASQRRPSRVPRLEGSHIGVKGSQTPASRKASVVKKAPMETPNVRVQNLKPIKTKHRPSKTPTGLPGDEPKPAKRNRAKLGEVVDTLLVPEHKAARKLVRRAQARRGQGQPDKMADKSGMTLYERIMAYRKLKQGSSEGEGSPAPKAEDERKLERSDTGWGSVDISQYTNGADDKRSPSPQPTITQYPKQGYDEKLTARDVKVEMDENLNKKEPLPPVVRQTSTPPVKRSPTPVKEQALARQSSDLNKHTVLPPIEDRRSVEQRETREVKEKKEEYRQEDVRQNVQKQESYVVKDKRVESEDVATAAVVASEVKERRDERREEKTEERREERKEDRRDDRSTERKDDRKDERRDERREDKRENRREDKRDTRRDEKREERREERRVDSREDRREDRRRYDRTPSPRKGSPSPRRRSPSPRKRSPSPRKRSPSPRQTRQKAKNRRRPSTDESPADSPPRREQPEKRRAAKKAPPPRKASPKRAQKARRAPKEKSDDDEEIGRLEKMVEKDLNDIIKNVGKGGGDKGDNGGNEGNDKLKQKIFDPGFQDKMDKFLNDI